MTNKNSNKRFSSIFIYLIISIISCVVFSKKLKEDLLDLPEDSYQLVQLDNENFNGYIKVEHFFVLVHNSWCVWSQKMEKILTKVNLHLKLEPQPFYIGILDNTVESIDLINELEQGKISYPKLLYFRNGKFVDYYKGRQSFKELYTWVKKRVYNYLPYHLVTEDQFNYKLKNAKRAFLYYPSNEEKQFLEQKEESLDDDTSAIQAKKKNSGYQAFENASKSKICEDVLFFYTTNKKLIENYNPENAYAVTYFRNGNNTVSYKNPTSTNEDGSVKTESLSLAEIKDYCKKLTYKNFFREFNERAVETIFIKKTPAIILFRSIFNNKTEYEEIKMETLSYMKKDKVVVITDISTKYSYKLANYFGITDEQLPALRVIDFNGRNGSPRKFSLSKEVKADNILNFVQLWESNSLIDTSGKKYSVKPINENSVALTITPAGFYEKVITNRKNVIVMFYADWCTKCKKHFPLFDVVAKKVNQIIYSFVFVDVGEHFDEIMAVEKVPSIFVYPSFDKENPIEYKGEIKAANLVDFLKKSIEKREDL